MEIEAFTELWATAWAALLGESEAYRVSAATWEGSILLVMTAPGPEPRQRAVFLDLWHGVCRVARVATPEDETGADFVLAGSAREWHRLLSGHTPAVMSILTGKLRLQRGSLARLVPYARAAQELLAAAAGMSTVYPEGWLERTED